ncbi:unnamed protein product [Strongylus vulgaris]|uniref:Uncharacterized protein n=1 Tax=Strongylus vulgaris TaxID=40348 RepID=A0A3P7JLY6_STRVU|nr:unnamed protein product [Strongylus vulgaris]
MASLEKEQKVDVVTARELQHLTKNKYDYPESGSKNAQSFLCLTLDANVLQDVGDYMRFAQIIPYMYNLPIFHKILAPILTDVISKKSLERKDTVFATLRHVRTLGGKGLKVFSKHKKSHFDLWHDLIALKLNTPMAVETWRNGVAKNIGPRCQAGKPNVAKKFASAFLLKFSAKTRIIATIFSRVFHVGAMAKNLRKVDLFKGGRRDRHDFAIIKQL